MSDESRHVRVDEINTGEPVAELLQLQVQPSPRLLEKLRSRIGRCLLAGDLAGLAWQGPIALLREFLGLIFQAWSPPVSKEKP